jgi:hypothetical protein
MRRRSVANQPDPDAPGRPCEAPDCAAMGEFKAPKARNRLNDYHWFCLLHVREYNAAWDYYRGMGPAEIEANLRNDTSWQRPTWPLGRLGGYSGGRGGFAEDVMADPLGILRDTPLHRKRTEQRDAPSAIPPELRAALDVLGLTWPLESVTLKTRYKELAKRFHPDANGGDRSAEDRLKDVNRAYSLLRQRLARSLVPEAAPAAAAP